MRKVVQVSLGGRAYQVEESGYESLHKYLTKAEKKLADNPDREEVLADIESAIAGKATAELKTGQTVIPEAAIKNALKEVGPVEGEDAADENEPVSGTQTRKLYLLPKEGKLAGVCAGLAAYFGMDATLMRVLFVLMLFITQGFWILVYILLAVAMPKAESAGQEAEAHGKPVTAQEIIMRLKNDVPADSVQRVGNMLSTVARIAARVLAICTAIAIGLLVTSWAWAIWLISFGQTELTGNLASFDRFEQYALVTAILAVVGLPLVALFRLLERVARPEVENPSQRSILPVGFWVVWAVLAVMLNGFAVAAIEPVKNNVDRNDGYFKVGKHSLCVNAEECPNEFIQQYETEKKRW